MYICERRDFCLDLYVGAGEREQEEWNSRQNEVMSRYLIFWKPPPKTKIRFWESRHIIILSCPGFCEWEVRTRSSEVEDGAKMFPERGACAPEMLEIACCRKRMRKQTHGLLSLLSLLY